MEHTVVFQQIVAPNLGAVMALVWIGLFGLLGCAFWCARIAFEKEEPSGCNRSEEERNDNYNVAHSISRAPRFCKR